ncbi:MAG TPA: hypothetical protein VN696_06015 [Pyrinomonadaceae bacterium]|nr:hypothetical protein [Pyrinomonadaceae bacterium]
MSKDERDMLDLLKTELDFIEKGGYGRDVRTPWKLRSTFRDSLSCVNYALPEKAHPCDECHLIDFVPDEKRGELVPCHSIPLTEAGDTVETLEANQSVLEDVLKHWLRKKIREVEAARELQSQSPAVAIVETRSPRGEGWGEGRVIADF